MKKSIIVATTLIGLISVSCQKMDSAKQNDNIVKTIATASIVDNDGTKTSLDLNTKKLTWTTGDKIYVIAPHSVEMFALNSFSLTSAAGSSRATFSSDGSVDFSGTPCYAAYYGLKSSLTSASYTQYRSSNETTRYNSFGLLVADMPSRFYGGNTYLGYFFPWTQKYSVSGPDESLLLMGSTKESSTSLTNLEFKNLTSILKFKIKDSRSDGNRATLDKIQVVCDNKPISGFCIGHMLGSIDRTGARDSTFVKNYYLPTSYDNKNTYSSITAGGSYGDTVILEDINTPLTNGEQIFYIVVLPGAHGSLSVTLTPTSGSSKVYNMSSFTSNQGTIHTFPVIDFGEL